MREQLQVMLPQLMHPLLLQVRTLKTLTGKMYKLLHYVAHAVQLQVHLQS